MPCMKMPYKTEHAAKRALVQIKTQKDSYGRGRLRSDGRRRPHFERRAYLCEECTEVNGYRVYHLTSKPPLKK